MKRLWMICMACLLCLSLQAEISHKRVVECPAFVTANTSEIEIRKITLTDEQTQVDAVFYGQPGTPAVLSSRLICRPPSIVSLCVKQTRYLLTA